MKDIPLDQIKDLIITNNNCSITVPLIRELSSRCINTVFCDAKRNPTSILVPINDSAAVTSSIHKQVQWDKAKKKEAWTQIVLNKMNNQLHLLDILGLDGVDDISGYIHDTAIGDSTNREGQVARVYFRNLFGLDFIRHEKDYINYMLNYGYAILRSAANRTIVLHGYNQALGIWHDNKQNPFNLACDVMEPFRPFVDRVVYNCVIEKNADKRALLSILQEKAIYNDRRTSIANAMDSFFEDIVASFEDDLREIGVVKLVA